MSDDLFSTRNAPTQDSNTVNRPVDELGRNSDDPDYDPFDWGESRPAVEARSPDVRFIRADGLLDVHAAFSRPLTDKEQAALKQPFSRSSNPHATAIKHLSQLYPGYLWTRTEYYVSMGQFQVKRDFLGVADVVGVAETAAPDQPDYVLAQLTTRTGINAHVRKYTSDAKSTDEIPTLRKLRAVLSRGRTHVVILGYFREMVPTADGKGMKVSSWLYVPLRVTEQVLQGALDRKRKPKGAA